MVKKFCEISHIFKTSPTHFSVNALRPSWPTCCNVLENRTAADDSQIPIRNRTVASSSVTRSGTHTESFRHKSLSSSRVWKAAGLCGNRCNPNSVLSILTTNCHPPVPSDEGAPCCANILPPPHPEQRHQASSQVGSHPVTLAIDQTAIHVSGVSVANRPLCFVCLSGSSWPPAARANAAACLQSFRINIQSAF